MLHCCLVSNLNRILFLLRQRTSMIARSVPTLIRAISLLFGVASLFPFGPQRLGSDRTEHRLALLSELAIAPPLVASGFHAEVYDRRANVQTFRRASGLVPRGFVKRAELRASWASQILPFPKSRNDESAIRDISPARIQDLILMTETQEQAQERLWEELQWVPEEKALLDYMQRYGLRARWKPYPGHWWKEFVKQDRWTSPSYPGPVQVQNIIARAEGREDALLLLKKELKLFLTSRQLLNYIMKYDLVAPDWWNRSKVRMLPSATSRSATLRFLRAS